jgi:hypothetical protein
MCEATDAIPYMMCFGVGFLLGVMWRRRFERKDDD